MRKITFEKSAFQDFIEWATVNKALYQRIVDLIMDMMRLLLSSPANIIIEKQE